MISASRIHSIALMSTCRYMWYWRGKREGGATPLAPTNFKYRDARQLTRTVITHSRDITLWIVIPTSNVSEALVQHRLKYMLAQSAS